VRLIERKKQGQGRPDMIYVKNFAIEEVEESVEKDSEVCNVNPNNLVISRFLKLNMSHVEYVMECLRKNTTKVYNIKAYLLAALFNAGATMSNYYRAEVNHDMPQFAG
jgi:hypothetical protein